MAEKKPHLFLKNEIKSIDRFPKRGIPPTEQEDEEIVIRNYEPKKRTLSENLRSFNTQIESRFPSPIVTGKQIGRAHV